MFSQRYFPKRFYPGNYFPPNGISIGPGRIEFTMPRTRLEYSMEGRLEFTLPRSVEEFAEVCQ